MDKSIKLKKSWYKRIWVWVGIVVVLAIISSANASKSPTNSTTAPTPAANMEEAPKSEEKPAKWDAAAAYAKISNGMTKAQVEDATGKESENCTESDTPPIGKTESCSYGNAFIDKASIVVIYSNGEVSSKTKSTY